MNSSPARVAAVTGGLMVAGGVFGAIAAAVGAAIGVTVIGEGFDPYGRMVIATATLVGGVLGAPLLPATNWLLLRRVPLGVSWLGTTVGAVAGGVLGWLAAVTLQGDPILWPILAALAGFFAAVIVLRRKFSAPAGGGRVRVPGA